jgi:hypothetical protein
MDDALEAAAKGIAYVAGEPGKPSSHDRMCAAAALGASEHAIRADERARLGALLLSDEMVEAVLDRWGELMAPRDDYKPKVRKQLKTVRSALTALASHPTADGPASPPLTDEERERLKEIAGQIDYSLESRAPFDPEAEDDSAFLRKLASQEKSEPFLPASTVDEMEIEERRSDLEFRARLERSIEENRELLERLGPKLASQEKAEGER